MHSIGRVELLSLQLPVVIGMFCAGIEHLGSIEATCLLANRLMLMQLSDKKEQQNQSLTLNLEVIGSSLLLVPTCCWFQLMGLAKELLLFLELIPWKVPRAT